MCTAYFVLEQGKVLIEHFGFNIIFDSPFEFSFDSMISLLAGKLLDAPFSVLLFQAFFFSV